MSSNSTIKAQWPDDEQQPSSKAYALSGKIMLASIITLFIIVFFLVLLHLYARWYLTRLNRHDNDTRHPNRQNRSTRMVYYIANNRVPGSSTCNGLDASILKSLPLFVYSCESKSNEDVVDCAVCLSEFEVGDTCRVLPKCKHCFHVECVDMWFCSHSTCPLCRSPVEPVQMGAEPGSSVTRKRVDVRIDVPVNEMVMEGEVRMTSPGSRLLSLKRMMNMGRVSPSGGVGPSCGELGGELRNELDNESRRRGNG